MPCKRPHEDDENTHYILWEKLFANHIAGKGLISNIYKELSKLNSKNINNTVRKSTKDKKKHFMEKDIQMANKHMKSYSTPLTIRELKIKTMMTYHYTLIRTAQQ